MKRCGETIASPLLHLRCMPHRLLPIVRHAFALHQISRYTEGGSLLKNEMSWDIPVPCGSFPRSDIFFTFHTSTSFGLHLIHLIHLRCKGVKVHIRQSFAQCTCTSTSPHLCTLILKVSEAVRGCITFFFVPAVSDGASGVCCASEN